MEALYPQDDGPEAREGTAAHYYATEYLQGRNWPVGTIAPNGHVVDQDMVKYGQSFIDDVTTGLEEFGPETVFRVEQMVFAPTLVHPDNSGTPDAYAISLVLGRLILWDYKYGHKYVEPYRFWQGIDYIAGIFEGLGLTLEDVADMAISIRVIQPRNYHIDGPVRRWDTDGATIWALIGQLRAAAYLAKTPGAPTRTGAHCTDCAARHACEAFMKVSAHALDIAGQTNPVELPPVALGQELERIEIALKRLGARRDGLHMQALSIIDKGGRVPAWTKGFVNSHEKWKVPVDQVVLLGDHMGVDLRDNRAKSPAEAKKLIPPEVVAEYAYKPTGAAKLIRVDSDKEASRAFAPPPPKK